MEDWQKRAASEYRYTTTRTSADGATPPRPKGEGWELVRTFVEPVAMGLGYNCAEWRKKAIA